MKHELLAAARAELQEAIEFYEGRRPGLGADFAAEVQATISRILLNPKMWPRVSQDVRRCGVERFPYTVLYQVRGDLVLIVAVAHHRRTPGYWRRRLNF